MKYTESALVFPCAGNDLIGVLALPEAEEARTGVLVVVGGPQYRVGSHRQFLLLSRTLAEKGFATMRFDFRGMGDSGGEFHGFEGVNDDIASAINAFRQKCKHLERIILLGLCDAASACLLYWDASRDQFVDGLILLNPWVRTETGLAKTHLKHYYGQRLLQAEFWRKLFIGKLDLSGSVNGFVTSLWNAGYSKNTAANNREFHFHKKMARGLYEFSGKALIVLSDSDYTAKEFAEMVQRDRLWQAALQRSHVSMVDIYDADHTFSSVASRDALERVLADWLSLSRCT